MAFQESGLNEEDEERRRRRGEVLEDCVYCRRKMDEYVHRENLDVSELFE